MSGRPCTLKLKCFQRRPFSRVLKRAHILQNSNISLNFRSKNGTRRTKNILLRSSLRKQANGSLSTNNKMAVDSFTIRFSVHVNLLFVFIKKSSPSSKIQQQTLSNEDKVITKVSLIQCVDK